VDREAERITAAANFESEDAFNDFLAGCFSEREAVFAAAENLVITSKSDGIRIPVGKNALLATGATWYVQRSAALHMELQRLEAATSEPSDPEELLSAAQGVIETLPVWAKLPGR
jgi:hypothetical protein